MATHDICFLARVGDICGVPVDGALVLGVVSAVDGTEAIQAGIGDATIDKSPGDDWFIGYREMFISAVQECIGLRAASAEAAVKIMEPYLVADWRARRERRILEASCPT